MEDYRDKVHLSCKKICFKIQDAGGKFSHLGIKVRQMEDQSAILHQQWQVKITASFLIQMGIAHI